MTKTVKQLIVAKKAPKSKASGKKPASKPKTTKHTKVQSKAKKSPKASVKKPTSKSKTTKHKTVKSKGKKVVSTLKYILKCLPATGIARNDFQWDMTVGAKHSAPDWDPEPECGKGLHGWLSGEGDPWVSDHHTDTMAVWLVLSTDAEVVSFEGKCKFPYCTVEFVGNRDEAVAEMRRLVPTAAVMYSNVTVKDREIVRVGDYSTVNAGDCSKVTAGNYSTVNVGNFCSVTVGDYCKVTAGNNSTVTAGDDSKVTAGDDSNVTSGNRSTVTAGYRSKVTAGNGSDFSIRWYDGKKYRVVTSYVGENGILPGVAYKAEAGKVVPS